MQKMLQFKLLSLLTCFLLISATQAFAQGSVSGTVTDADTGEELIGVNVVIPSLNIGDATGPDGTYLLSDVPEGEYRIEARYVGFETVHRTITVNDGEEAIVNFEMSAAVDELGEVIVTAFGVEQEKKQIGYAVQELSGEELMQSQESNLVSALQGRIAGVNIQNTSGAAGAGVDIIIRGINSLSPSSNNQPLFIIDGIPVSNQTATGNVLPSEGSNSPGSGEQFSFSNRVADINPNDIENISVLKGASATALYGLRASNGAVVITTKKGQAGAPQISFDTSVGFSEVNMTPDIQDQYQIGFSGTLPGVSSSLVFWQFGPPVTDSADPIYNNFERLFRTGSNVNNSLSISGGNESTTYFTSFSNTYQQGIVPNTDWQRSTFKLSGSQDLSESFNIDASLSYANSGGTRPTGGDKSIMSSLSFWPSSLDINDYLNPDGTQNNPTNGIIDNPRYFAENSTLKDDVNRTIGNLSLNYEVADWLSFKYQLGLDTYNDSRVRFVPPNLDVGTQVNGFIIEENINYREFNSNLLASLDHQFSDKLRGTLLVGNQITDIDSKSVNTRGEGLNIPNFVSLANTTNAFIQEGALVRRLVGVFADAKIDYDGTYFLTVTGRNDWSSTLPEDNRSFFYPSVSLGYVFTETLGLADSDLFPYGKLRLSLAKVGKDAPPFSVGTRFQGASGFPFDGEGGFVQDIEAGDANLKPEQTTSFEIGAEATLLSNRLNFDFTYFNQTSIDQIVAFPVSNAAGLARFTTNAGEIESKGVELLIEGTPVQSTDFSWNVAINWSTNTSNVKSMPEGLQVIEFANSGFPGVVSRIEEGGELGDLYGYRFNYDQDGNLLINEDGVPTINTSELVKVGNAFPDWQGGINNTLNFKNLSFSFLIDIKKGGQSYDAGQRNSIRNGLLEITELREKEVIFNGVKESDGTPNDIPFRINESYYRNANTFNRASEIIIQDTDWVKLRNVRLAYQLPQTISEQFPISGATFSVTGRNLLTSTPFRGYDPEGQQYSSGSNVFGFTGLNIPSTRSVTFSLNLRF
ncbi:SusC/RagA family TonB-linked outer membrane protein [Rhodohalobacter sp.]|uniref:SusC/RagA family TonB-linked outer membrane protein n=1 Tax=Rhodohalobacter sp. TaxID=1974210 RepID=UPI0035676EC5